MDTTQTPDREAEMHEEVLQRGHKPVNDAPRQGDPPGVQQPPHRWQQDSRPVDADSAIEHSPDANPRQNNLQG